MKAFTYLLVALLISLAKVSFAQDTPELLAPAYGQTNVPALHTHFQWVPKNGYHNWVLQVADNPGMAHPIINVPVQTTDYVSTVLLPPRTLYWKVWYINDSGEWYYSGVGMFTVRPFPVRIERMD